MASRFVSIRAPRRLLAPFRHRTATVGSAIIVGAGAVAFSTQDANTDRSKSKCAFPLSLSSFYPKTLCDGDGQAQELIMQTTRESSSMLDWSPSLQAGVRALRLIQTTIRIVWEYEAAKLQRHLPFSSANQEDTAIQALEAKVEDKEKALEEAQIIYARENNGSDTNSSTMQQQQSTLKRSETSRKEIKRQQKKRMQQAAQELANAETELASIEGQSGKSALHKKCARRLLALCRDNGGVYIKVGQHLANLDYLIPQEYIDVLSSLFNDAPRSSFDDVARVIEEDLGDSIDSLFDNFDPVPIASASLAQVHVAYDKTTKEKLAVKVQHRGLRETSVGDITAVCFVVGVIDSFFQDFTFGWIADEMAPQLPKELDFTKEGKNAEKAAADLQNSGLACCIPKIFWNKSSQRVLTMTFEEGFKSTDIDSIERAGLKKR